MRKRSRIQSKLVSYIWICVIPFIALFLIAIVGLFQYYRDYDRLVRNITAANEYSMSFEDNLNEMMYRIIIGSANWSNPEEKLEGEDPKGLIAQTKERFTELRTTASEKKVRADIDALIKLLGILDQRVDDILKNVEEGGHYDENMEMLDMNIRTLTSLIQVDIQKYIYDEATNMEKLRGAMAGRVVNTTRMLICLMIIMIAVILFFSKRLSRRLTKPITGLCNMTEKFAGGDFTVEYHTESNDEMETLAESFNSMVKEIQNLVDDIHKEQEIAKEAELRLLQEQINPHFLYNTLDAIMWMTESGENQKAIRMVQELSNFFRISLSKGQSEITISNEKEHIRSYLEIQHYRYQDIMEYEIDFSEDILDKRIQKLTLQPLVENALYHGIKNKRGKGMIRVTGQFDGDDIVLKVSDNGRGMTEEELKVLRDRINGVIPEEDSGFGMRNVEQRLKMNYGNGYGISVESIYGEGTDVTVRIPAV